MGKLHEALAEGRGVRVPDLARHLGISRMSLYYAIRREEVPATKVGRRLIITAPVARRLLGLEGA